MCEKLIYCEEMYGSEDEYKDTSYYIDLFGNEINKTPLSNPYNFDEYIIWKGDYKNSDLKAYSDRLQQWNFEKYNTCIHNMLKTSGWLFSFENSNFTEYFLSSYYGKNIKLTAIAKGCNVSSGFPYYVFFYRVL